LTNTDSVSISNHIEHIGHRTFALCSSITNISLPNSIDTIDDFAFSGCSQLESIIIPSSVVTLGYGAFGNCSSLKEITFEGNSPIINLSDPLLFGDVTATVYYPANNPTWTEEVMQDYGGDITWVAYNEEHTHEYGTDHKCECGAIGGICGENLVWTLDEEGTLTISGTGDIEEQPWSAYGSSIKSLIIEEGATGIGVSIFANSTNLDNVVLPNSIIYIDVSAFHSCVKLNSISIPASVTAIDPDAFAGCDNLTGIWVEKDNTKYTNDSYGVLFNKDMTQLVKYPEGLSGAYTIPNGVITIGLDAFMSSQNLTGVTFSDTVTEISDSGFIGCNSLKNVVIPDTITKIGSMAFAYCGGLERITFEGNAPSLNDIAFAETTTTAYYPTNNPTWTDVVGQNYAGSITWVPYGDTTEEPDITGYSAGLSTTTPTTTTGEKVYVSVAVNHAEESTFNAGELVFTYDSARLSFNQTESTLGNATVKAANGTLTLEDYGAAKNCGNGIYTLVFDAIADGNATVKLTSAAFSNQENAAASDLIAGVAYPDSVHIVISKKTFAVTLPDGMTGAATATDGDSYTFRISDENYTYSNVTATVDGQTVSVTDNGDGSYTIGSVSGVLKITATRTPKSYKVSFTGTAAADITGASGTATYGTDYKFTIPTADGWAYSLGGITIGGNNYTGYNAEGSEYTIPGTAITGEIVITVNKAQTTASVTVTGSGAGAAAGYDATAEIGESYTLTITPENGYNYTVTATMDGKPVELAQNGNKYTTAEVTGNIVFTIERTVIVSGVTVSEYVSVDGNKVWLVQNTVTLAEGKVPTYNGGNMFWSEEYDAYCYLVIAATLSEEDAKADIGIADGTAVAVDYGMDVNMTGNVDANDAQLTYNIYNAYYDSFSETATMEKFLRADVNKDGKVNTTDSAAIINKILNG